ncbi:MAG TPA: hypothetical protein VHS58_11245 [Acetobacteraceae bacterium]|nr:hypothetical protein [Acetobacteraceae bacterium]
MHELIKKWNGEVHDAMFRAIDHPFPNQPISDGTEGGCTLTQDSSHVAASIRAAAELRHRPQIALFRVGHLIKSNPKKALIQAASGLFASRSHVIGRDDRAG